MRNVSPTFLRFASVQTKNVLLNTHIDQKLLYISMLILHVNISVQPFLLFWRNYHIRHMRKSRFFNETTPLNVPELRLSRWVQSANACNVLSRNIRWHVLNDRLQDKRLLATDRIHTASRCLCLYKELRQKGTELFRKFDTTTSCCMWADDSHRFSSSVLWPAGAVQQITEVAM